jgi:hypothetical protein
LAFLVFALFIMLAAAPEYGMRKRSEDRKPPAEDGESSHRVSDSEPQRGDSE